jgi:hypothetical protein
LRLWQEIQTLPRQVISRQCREIILSVLAKDLDRANPGNSQSSYLNACTRVVHPYSTAHGGL